MDVFESPHRESPLTAPAGPHEQDDEETVVALNGVEIVEGTKELMRASCDAEDKVAEGAYSSPRSLAIRIASR
jgi:hypothetical protein